MKRSLFKHYLAHLDRLTANQRRQVIAALQPPHHATTIPPQVREREHRLDLERKCLHCGSKGTRKHSKSSGLMRFRGLADGCGKTFTALTRTQLAKLRHRAKWGFIRHACGSVRPSKTLRAGVGSAIEQRFGGGTWWRDLCVAQLHDRGITRHDHVAILDDARCSDRQ